MKKTLLLVDGSSYLYRAYHAMPDLRNAQGQPTGALYGVINMLRRLLQDYQADYMVCVFDAKGRTFRDDLYDQYKANRPSMPEDMAVQIEPIHKAVRAMGWHLICQPGVEADDIIGTLSRLAAENGIETVVSTGDKDLAQLVNEHVQLVNTMSNEKLDVEGVTSKYGVRPDQIIDYLMLIGDTSDNIPGVPKVGPKTAAKWLAEYGSLDELLQHADKIKGVAGQNLRDFSSNFDMTRKLVTVKLDCEVPGFTGDFEALEPEPRDNAVLQDIYETYGFRSWLRELTADPTRVPAQDARVEAETPAAPSELDYQTVTTKEQLQSLLSLLEKAELVALDTETTSLDPLMARLVGLSVSVKVGQAFYMPVAHRGSLDVEQLDKDYVLETLRPWLENAEAAKVLHNAKYDTHVLLNEKVSLRGIREDTMLQAYVLQSHKRVGMEELALQWLGLKGASYEDICGKGAKQIGFDEVDIPVASQYACEDADYTLRLHQCLRPQVAKEEGLERIYLLEVQASDVLTIVERNGVKIDVPTLARQSHELGQKMLELENKAYELADQPFNMNSPKQVGEILFGKLGIPVVRKTASGAPSTDEDVLTRLAQDYPLPQVLLEYRGLAKLKSTYTDKLPKMVNPDSGRVHTRYAQAAVITGRLASSDPNLQNIPVRTAEGRRVRAAFVSELGKVVSADYSQIELRVMAHVSGDENLQQVFEQGGDVHTATAAEIFGVDAKDVSSDQRRAAKAINFGLIYGMGEFGLASNLGITRDAARAYIDRYFARYPGVASYMTRIKAQAHEQGYVETVFGRRLWLPELKGAKGPRMAGAERAAINAPMQGTSADLIKMAMVAVQRWLEEKGLRTQMVMQVHDELVFDVPEDELDVLRENLPGLMCNVAKLDVPLVAEVGVGDNWEQAH
ncbi:DNA polymerase I [Alcaligenes faecalis]|uniref:DNA polymerase I n=1 Tax=Alcaligenes faecalis TaxID=511 RepID=UPI001C9A4B62|nr:DNA polymerase I [Alcaligenes faecalis]MBY6309305.1 DNA polymerase I [Alcaligenes faecalis]MBY6317164.1 DNA polymerase I [Alcaligenes faecalis]MBY6391246.1 DNA polymerase I [Alcaligenes faecalis]